MYELVYRSVAVENITADDILDILNEARDFNAKHDIAGCLLFFNNEFVQILEGEKEGVKLLFEKIKKDHRHTDVLLLNEDEKEERIFKQWNMAYYDINNDNKGEMDRLLFIRNFMLAADITEKPTHAISLFWYVAKELVGPWSLGQLE
jgi:hypothetical protein